MPDITMTRQTSLRGTALQNAVNAMVAAMGRRQPFNMAPIQPRWESGTRLTFTASAMGQQQANGSIDIRDGSPSTVTAQVNLLTSLSRGYRSQVEQAMVEESERNMPIVGATTTAQPSTTTRTTQTAQETTTRTRGDFDWNMFGNVLSNVFGGAASGLDAYNQAMGYTAAQHAQNIAAETAQSAGVQVGPGFVLGPGKVVGPEAPPPGPTVVTGGQQLAPVMTTPARTPTWGWVVLGLGAAGLVGFTVWVVTRKRVKKNSQFGRFVEERGYGSGRGKKRATKYLCAEFLKGSTLCLPTSPTAKYPQASVEWATDRLFEEAVRRGDPMGTPDIIFESITDKTGESSEFPPFEFGSHLWK